MKETRQKVDAKEIMKITQTKKNIQRTKALQ
jgi:hypothetical protein